MGTPHGYTGLGARATDPGLEVYLAAVRQAPPLSVDEEDRLLAALGRGDPDARCELVRRSLRLVPPVAEHYLAPGVRMLDLIEHGNVGLVRAVEAYAPADGPFYVRAAREICWSIEAFLKSRAAEAPCVVATA